VIDRCPSGLYPLLVVSVQITPEPNEAEREAILAALAEEAVQPGASEWATALLPARDDDEREP
jgi:hypothetical protein